MNQRDSVELYVQPVLVRDGRWQLLVGDHSVGHIIRHSGQYRHTFSHEHFNDLPSCYEDFCDHWEEMGSKPAASPHPDLRAAHLARETKFNRIIRTTNLRFFSLFRRLAG
jgi:hypothetical protein